MTAFFVAFTWKRRTAAKHFKSGATVIAVDAADEQSAKQECRRRFPDKALRFTRIELLHV